MSDFSIKICLEKYTFQIGIERDVSSRLQLQIARIRGGGFNFTFHFKDGIIKMGFQLCGTQEETMCRIDQCITSIQNCLETIFMSREYKGYKAFLNEIKDETLKTRAELSLKYYIKMAVRYKWLWNILSFAGIILPATATCLASLNADKYTGAVILITACTTVTTGCLALFKCADKKTSYRNSVENLKSELCAYASQKGPYSEASANRDALLFDRMESIIQEGYQRIEALEKSTDSNK